MNLKMASAGSTTMGLWILPCIFGLCSVVLLLLCMKKKKKTNTVTMVKYVTNEEEGALNDRRSHTSTSPTNSGGRPAEQRYSQNSIPNEHRILPAIPVDQTNGSPPTPDQVAVSTPGAVSLDGNPQSLNSSPKKNRRLPALPPTGQAEARMSLEPDKDIEGTYEDLRDDVVPKQNPQNEVIGSGDSSLYAKVTDDIEKQQDDSDLYAQVGEGDTAATAAKLQVEKKNSSGSNKAEAKADGRSSAGEEEKTMDSPTSVTYASVDKMKKTVSIKRSSGSQSFVPPPPPPIPVRNFDENDDSSSVTADSLPPPSPVMATEMPSTSSAPEPSQGATSQQTENSPDDQSGPAYDTLSVRESFAHQRLRQIVEDEKRNRYVNTNQAINSDSDNTNQPDVYAQIEDEAPEAVYESVSAPGSADGTVGVTGRNVPVQNGVDVRGYVTIGEMRSDTATGSQPPMVAPPPPNGSIPTSDPHYEDINPR